MDTITAEAELNKFLDRQAGKTKEQRAGQEHANRIEAELRAAEERRTAQIRGHNRWEWVRYFERLSRNHARLAQENEARAAALIEEGGS